MKYFFQDLFGCIKQKRGYFICICLLTLLAIILAIFASLNFNSDNINLDNIAYIKYLKNYIGLMPFIFGMIFSLAIFLLVMFICSCKSMCLPLGIVFYLYLVYSQTVVYISLIKIYGFLNCLILALFLLVYLIVIFFLFALFATEIFKFCNNDSYFSECCSPKNCKMIAILILILLITVLFCLLLTLLKSFVILLVY